MSISKDKDIIALSKLKDDLPVELESQFILRLPHEAGQELRKSLRSGVMNIKDRLTIQLENDMRHGIVRFDNWVFSAKQLDLPCVCESLKTIDKKTFYKTADVSQILVCKEEDDSQTTEEEDSPKKKDEGKTEKKFLYPHGVTPPLKNVRKRRFRKTLKKKYVDAPEIEKEVKRLFRVDNEAVSVRWDVITDEDDANKKLLTGESQASSAASPTASGFLLSNSQSLDVAEHDIFGEELSSSEEEHDVNIMDSGDDESSRLSTGTALPESKRQFMRQILQRNERVKEEFPSSSNQDHIITALKDAGLVKQPLAAEAQDVLIEKREQIQQQLLDVQARRQAQELEICSIENQALKQRFQSIIDSLIEEENQLKQQYKKIESVLNRD